MTPMRNSVAAFLLIVILPAAPSAAQEIPADFGRQQRANAASQLVVIAVQRAISALPPSSGQSATYSYDPRSDTYVVSRRPGPVSLRTPSTLREGAFGLRVAASYFELTGGFGPIPYRVKVPGGAGFFAETLKGLIVDARVGVINVAADYGLTDRVQLGLNVPITIVDASADETALARGEDGLELARTSLADSTSLDSKARAGLSRIEVGAKARVLSLGALDLAGDLRFFAPSPSQAELAGSDSPSLLGRVIIGLEIAPEARILADAGYDYDFDVAELRRALWDVGISMEVLGAALDLGFGGSVYDTGVEWTPSTAFSPPTPEFRQGLVGEVIGDNRVGTNYVDFLGGVKLRLAPGVLLTGSLVAALTKEGLRPDASGTLGVELYF